MNVCGDRGRSAFTLSHQFQVCCVDAVLEDMDFFGISVILSSVLALQGSLATARSVDFTCQLDGYFPDPNDCGAYYECELGQVKRQLCPGQLRWRTTGSGSGYCDLALITPCPDKDKDQNGEDKDNDEENKIEGKESTGNVPFSCPKVGIGYHSDPADCNAFYHCHEGKQARQKCPPHLRWRTSFPGSGYCDLAIITPCNEVTADAETTTPPSVGDNEQVTVATAAPFNCPAKVNGFFGDKEQCEQFYLCVDGRRYSYTCPDGMKWAERIGACDYAFKVPCLRVIKYLPKVTQPAVTDGSSAATQGGESTSGGGGGGGSQGNRNGGTFDDTTFPVYTTTTIEEDGDDMNTGSGDVDDLMPGTLSENSDADDELMTGMHDSTTDPSWDLSSNTFATPPEEPL